MNARFRLLAVSGLLSTVAVSGCVQRTERGASLSAPAYTDPTKIEMLSAEPARPHVVLGEIQLDEGDWRNEQVAETKIRTEAGRMQADAVIMYGRGSAQRPRAIRYTGTTPARGPVVTRNTVGSGAVGSGGSGDAGTGRGGAFPDGGDSGLR
jgi:hypothetical protein